MKINQSKKDTSKSIESQVSPVAPLSLREAMNRLFNESIWDPFDHFSSLGLSGYESGLFPRVDITEDQKNITVTAEIPGINPDQIEIEVSEDSLAISGQIDREEAEEGKTYYRLERECGQFRRVLPLPSRVDSEKVKARAQNGLLTITLPKSVDSQRRRIKVEK